MDDQDEHIEDIYARMRDATTGLQLTKKTIKFKNTKNCFQGTDFVQWLVTNMSMHKFIAEQIGQNFMDRLLMHRAHEDEFSKDDEQVFRNDSSLYRFLADEEPQVLNFKRIFSGYVRSSQEIISDMSRYLYRLYHAHISNPDLKVIDYGMLLSSKEYRKYVNATVELQVVQPTFMKTERDILAFFVNVYNMLVFHIAIEKDRPLQKHDVFLRFKYTPSIKFGYFIGGQKYTLSDIEQFVFQMGSKGARKQTVVFAKHERKKQLSAKFQAYDFDPRIHFLLVNSTAEGSGFDLNQPLRVVDPKNLVSEMQSCTEKYLNSDEIKVYASRKLIILPSLFDQHRNDFGRDSLDILHWISNFLQPGQKKNDFFLLMADNETKVSFDYSESIVATNNVSSGVGSSISPSSSSYDISTSFLDNEPSDTPAKTMSRSNSNSSSDSIDAILSMSLFASLHSAYTQQMIKAHAAPQEENSWKMWKPTSSSTQVTPIKLSPTASSSSVDTAAAASSTPSTPAGSPSVPRRGATLYLSESRSKSLDLPPSASDNDNELHEKGTRSEPSSPAISSRIRKATVAVMDTTPKSDTPGPRPESPGSRPSSPSPGGKNAPTPLSQRLKLFAQRGLSTRDVSSSRKSQV